MTDYPDDWKNLPIPDITLARQQPIVDLVDRILAAKVGQAFLPAAQTRMSAPPSLADLEAEIDRLVSALYGLTAPEIAIVESNS